MLLTRRDWVIGLNVVGSAYIADGNGGEKCC